MINGSLIQPKQNMVQGLEVDARHIQTKNKVQFFSQEGNEPPEQPVKGCGVSLSLGEVCMPFYQTCSSWTRRSELDAGVIG